MTQNGRPLTDSPQLPVFDPIPPVTGVSYQQACGASLSVLMLEMG
jgi:hypothetical protein